MKLKEYIILKKCLKKALISRIGGEISNDYLYGVDRDLFSESELSIIKRFIMLENFEAINLKKNVVIFPKDIFDHFKLFYTFISIFLSSILSIVSIIISICALLL